MRRLGATRSVLLVMMLSSSAAAQFPQTEIANAAIRAKLYLPDAQSGYYRATRFDWSGVVAGLEWKGHKYFGQWFDRYDPKIHDAITGPVEEFLTNNAGLGYDEVKAGESFVRIGVGAVRKAEEPSYGRFRTYEITDPGRWSVKKGKDWIEFTHRLGDTAGYAYVYRKKVRLDGNRMVLEHHLKNTGRKAISTSVYNHNFFMLDMQPTGPDVAVQFRFDPRPVSDLRGLAAIRGKEMVFLQELQRGQTVQTFLEGYGGSVSDYDFRVENRRIGAGVRQTGDRPISKLLLWSIRTTVCPEAYIDLSVPQGKAVSWRIVYEFYEVAGH